VSLSRLLAPARSSAPQPPHPAAPCSLSSSLLLDVILVPALPFLPVAAVPPFAEPYRSPCTLCPRLVPTPRSLSSLLTLCFVRAVAQRAVDVPKSLTGVFYMWRSATIIVPPRRVLARVASSPSMTPLELVDDPLLQCAEPLLFVVVRHHSSSFVEAALYLLYCCEQGRS
jgi:hypothetical protein